MKHHIYGKLLTLALSTTMVLSLAACGNPTATADAPSLSASTPSTAQTHVGSVLLSVNPEIEMRYDKSGNVVTLTGQNADGRSVLDSYTDYEGRPCKTVVGELITAINAEGYFDTTINGQERNIVLKLERGSQPPNDDFLTELAQTVQTAVDTDQIGSRMVALDDDDFDAVHGDKGYINAAAAQNILATQLNRNDIQFVEKSYDLDDGEYEMEFVLDGVNYSYEVNARTGKVTEMDMERSGNGVTDYNDTDYGPGNDGVTDYNDTDYGPGNDGVTDYNDTDYGPGSDGVTDYNDTDYGPGNDGVTDYNDTDYGPGNDGVTDYNDTDYGPGSDGVTDYNNGNTNYGPGDDGATDYNNGNTNYSDSNDDDDNDDNDDGDDD